MINWETFLKVVRTKLFIINSAGDMSPASPANLTPLVLWVPSCLAWLLSPFPLHFAVIPPFEAFSETRRNKGFPCMLMLFVFIVPISQLPQRFSLFLINLVSYPAINSPLTKVSCFLEIRQHTNIHNKVCHLILQNKLHFWPVCGMPLMSVVIAESIFSCLDYPVKMNPPPSPLILLFILVYTHLIFP